MKKMISIVLCLALLCTVFAVALHAQDQPQGSLVVLGDSIAAGYGVTLEQSYAWQVAQNLGLDLHNFAFANGETSNSLLWRVRTNQTVRQHVADADVIVISIGGNDFLLYQGIEGVPGLIARALAGDQSFMPPIWDTFATNFAAVINELRALNPDAMLVVQTLYNPAQALPVPSLRRAVGTAMQGINVETRDYLAQNPGVFVIADVYSAFVGRSRSTQLDFIHPNAAGHAMIAAVVENTIAGTQHPVPRPSLVCDVLSTAIFPVVWLLDFLLIRVSLRLLWPVFN